MDCERWVGVEAQVLHKAPVGGIRQGGGRGVMGGCRGVTGGDRGTLRDGKRRQWVGLGTVGAEGFRGGKRHQQAERGGA